MIAYRAPLQDMEFVLHELAGLDEIAALPGFADSSPDLTGAILEEAGRIATEVLAPLNQRGDRLGAGMEGDQVKTAEGWTQAYRTLADGNWIGLSCDARYGGMGLPFSINAAVNEMWLSANSAFTLCPMLTQGAINAIASCGNDRQKALYLPKLASGQWAGTMDLSEAAAGSDLGAIRTKAVKEGDVYRICGQKIFITYGDHDLTENIIHLVLARTPDAPAGIKGISLFIVPKIRVAGDGSLGAANDVRCLALEHKLGIHASPTATLAFGDREECLGDLVGEENHGLEYMFVMMNHARLNVGLQGLALAERAYQQARAFAFERVQGRVVGCKTAGPIVDHPDVRRMLMTMKAEIEAMRALSYLAATALDKAGAHPDAATREQAGCYAELLNPIVKGWCSERGVVLASLGLQVHGGVGYVEDTGTAQHLRDARITTIYEGTTAIQANDLVNRKILRDGGACLRSALAGAKASGSTLSAHPDRRLRDIGESLVDAVTQAERVLDWLLRTAPSAPEIAAAGAVPLLLLLGGVLGGHQMARAAGIAMERLAAGQGDTSFYQAKIGTAWHYALSVLPRTQGLATSIIVGSRTVMALSHEQL